MDLQDILSKRFSKDEKLFLAQSIVNDPGLVSELWRLIKTGDSPVPEYGSWLLDASFALDASILDPHLEDMFDYLSVPNHNSIHRNLSKILSRVKVPEHHQGEIYSLCIDRMLDPNVKVAIKAHSMEIAFNIVMEVPDLKEELAMVIKDQMEFNTAGFKSRGRRILKQLKA